MNHKVPRRHPVTLRHTLLAAVCTNMGVGEDAEVWTQSQVVLIAEMFNIGKDDTTSWDAIRDVITGTITLETGIAILNAAARKTAELAQKEN